MELCDPDQFLPFPGLAKQRAFISSPAGVSFVLSSVSPLLLAIPSRYFRSIPPTVVRPITLPMYLGMHAHRECNGKGTVDRYLGTCLSRPSDFDMQRDICTQGTEHLPPKTLERSNISELDGPLVVDLPKLFLRVPSKHPCPLQFF